MASITLEEFITKLEEARKVIERSKQDIEVIALKGVEGPFKQRIFRDGKTVDGNYITSKVLAKPPREGVYSKGYGRKRRRADKKTELMNLFFDGSTLHDMIGIEHVGDEGALRFLTTKAEKVAEYTEEYRKAKIFALNEEESQLVVEGAAAAIIDLLTKQLFS